MTIVGLTKNELGATGHSLRAQFAENQSLLLGIIPATLVDKLGIALGGKQNQQDNDEMVVQLKKLAESLGHGRIKVIEAYCGSLSKTRIVTQAIEEQARAILYAALKTLDELPDIPEERIIDCQKILAVLHQSDIDLTLRQSHALWMRWSDRNGVEWLSPSAEIIPCLLAVCADLKLRTQMTNDIELSAIE